MKDGTDQPGSKERLVHIDLARALMLFLGIPFHISEAYRLDYQWYVASGQPSLALTFLSGIIHSFRMPALFLLSGYFAEIVVARKGTRAWAVQRVNRLLVPLVATTLCLGILEVCLSYYFRSGSSVSAIVQAALAQGPGAWIMHRWFLVVLLFYSLSFIAWRIGRGRAPGSPPIMPRTVSGPLLVVVLALTGLVSATVGKLAEPVVGDTLRFYGVAVIRYAPMFILGVWLGKRPGDFDSFLTLTRQTALAGGSALLVYVMLFVPPVMADGALSVQLALKRYAFPVFEPIAGWYVTIMFLALIRDLTRAWLPGGLPAFARLLVDNAMAIYLLHMSVVIVATGLLLRVDWPPLTEFLVATIASTFLCVAAVALLGGRPLFEFVFNGRRLPLRS